MNEYEVYTPTKKEQEEYHRQLAESQKPKIEKMNEPKLTKVKSVQPNGTFESQYGADLGNGTRGFFKFEYEMEDGAVVNANHKKNEPFKQGDQVEYIITKPQYNSGNVSKPKDQNYSSGKPSYSKSITSSNASFALSYAKDQVVTFGLPQGVEVSTESIADFTHAIADKHLEWLTNNSK